MDNFLTVLVIAVALGTDAFSLAIGIGMARISWRQVALIAGVISVFHIFMPLAGFYLGDLLGRRVGQLSTTIGALVLIIIGAQMIWEGLKPLVKVSKISTARATIIDPPSRLPTLQGTALLALATSVSLDALSVGFGLGTLRFNLFLTVLTMGIVAGLMTATGLFLGQRVGKLFGERAEAIGGLILVAIGVKLLFF